MKRVLWTTLLGTALGAAAPEALAQAEFQGLGNLGINSEALAVSADGAIVVGSTDTGSGRLAFRWDGNMGPLFALPNLQGVPIDSGHGVDASGTRVVGEAALAVGSTRAAVWDGLSPLDIGEGGAWGVSDDGNVVVGEQRPLPGDSLAFSWNAGVYTFLGSLGSGVNIARAASADGSVIVGNSGNVAFRWESGQITTLPGLEPYSSIAWDVTADGSVIVGGYLGGLAVEAFRWQGNVATRLGSLWTADTVSTAFGVSADGAIVVGESFTDAAIYEAFIWNQGMRNLKQVLEGDFGLVLTGWSLERATDVSADGTVIVGFGTNPVGVQEAWRAVVPRTAGLCGDINDDGSVTQADRDALRAFLADPVGAPLSAAGVAQCTVILPAPRPCDYLDVTVIGRDLMGLSPGIAQVCPAATGS